MTHARLSLESRYAPRFRLRLRLRRWMPGAVAFAVVAVAGPVHAEKLSVEQAVARAAKQNPTLLASLHDVQAARQAVVAAREILTPTLFLGLNGGYGERFSASKNGVTRNDDQSVNGETGVRANTAVGTSIEVGVSSGVAWRTSNINVATTDSVTLGPIYSSDIYTNVRQPLLRGAGEDGVMATVRQARSSQSAAEHQRDQTASELVRDVVSAYWELWYAERSVDVQKAALALAEKQHSDAQKSAEILENTAGTDILRFAVEVATVRENLNGALATRATRAVELGRLLSMSPGKSMSLAAARALPAPVALPNLDTLLADARKSSPSLLALAAQIDARREAVVGARDANQPKLDLVLALSMGGVWTSATISSLALPGDRPVFTAMLGLELETPLGPGAASPALARARQEAAAAQARYEAAAEALDANIAGLTIDLDNAENRVALASKTAGISRQLADAERKRYTLGGTAPQEVVRAQQAQREAELRLLRAIVDRATAQLALQHNTARLLLHYAVALPSTAPEDGLP